MRALLAAFFVALPAGVIACMREGAPPVAPVEVAVADLADARPGAISVAPPPRATVGQERCTGRLKARTINTAATCTLDERLSQGAGMLLYPCSGIGPVEAVFGEHRFQGTMNGASVVLNLTTELDWEDGCHWQTTQVIEGELANKKATLAWSYTEMPVVGTSCYGSCDASAEIEVELPRALAH